PEMLAIELKGVRSVKPRATATVLAAPPEATNSIDEPTKVVPVTRTVDGVAPSFTHTFPPHSITVLQLEAR
ncbi:MAG TPA: alpha-L-arabinofuranosidase C-terminal domain-containing protein, partial [Armatimonadota bacterium]|nr:alpha-L-arabinofuranosidase C-terminal domain-containing protein [Armatimonadota bacterium]